MSVKEVDAAWLISSFIFIPASSVYLAARCTDSYFALHQVDSCRAITHDTEKRHLAKYKEGNRRTSGSAILQQCGIML